MTSLFERFFPPLSAVVVDDNGYASASPLDDYWYTPRGLMNNAGMLVTPDTALKISAFFACLRVIGETILSAPLPVYRRLPNGDRERAPEHPLYALLHDDKPNDEQTSGGWLETHTIHTAMRGTSYSRIHEGGRGPIGHLEYLIPDRVRLERLPSGIWRYKVKDLHGMEETLAFDQLFRLPGLSSNGITGLSVLDHARESLGLSLALQQHAGRSFSQGVRPSGVLKHPGILAEEPGKRLRSQFDGAYAGAINTGKTLLLEQGMEWQQVAMTNQDAQMLASEQWQVADIARWFRMPLIMIQEHEKSTSWGTGVEHQQIGFVVFCMLPWFIRWEQWINKQLIRPLGGDYFCEFLVEGLLRGDIKTRYEAYQIAVGGNGPWMARNEVRRKENLNAGPSELDEFLQPMNMVEAGTEPQPRGTVGRSPAAAQLPNGTDPRMKTFARVLAGQVVRKEATVMQKLAQKHADDGAGWEAAVREFYDEMATEISERCYVEPAGARGYADRQRDEVLSRGVGVAQQVEATKADELLGLMIGGLE